MKIEKVENLKLIYIIKTEYVIHIKNLKQALNHNLILKWIHRVIKFNQKDCSKQYIDKNTDLKKKRKTILKNIF